VVRVTAGEEEVAHRRPESGAQALGTGLCAVDALWDADQACFDQMLARRVGIYLSHVGQHALDDGVVILSDQVVGRRDADLDERSLRQPYPSEAWPRSA